MKSWQTLRCSFREVSSFEGLAFQPVVWAVIGLALVSGFGTKYRDPASSCPGNLKDLGRGLYLYLSDSDETLPPSIVNHWMDAAVVGGAQESSTRCTAVTDVGGHGYAMSILLVGKKLSGEAAAGGIWIFDSNLKGRNSVGTLKSLPDPYRHEVGNFALIGDLSVRAIK